MLRLNNSTGSEVDANNYSLGKNVFDENKDVDEDDVNENDNVTKDREIHGLVTLHMRHDTTIYILLK